MQAIASPGLPTSMSDVSGFEVSAAQGRSFSYPITTSTNEMCLGKVLNQSRHATSPPRGYLPEMDVTNI